MNSSSILSNINQVVQLNEAETTFLESVKPDAELTGCGKGRFGETRTGFEVNGKINRHDFGLNFNMATEAGNLIVGEEGNFTLILS